MFSEPSPTSPVACESFEGNAISVELSIPRNIMGNQKRHEALNQRLTNAPLIKGMSTN